MARPLKVYGWQSYRSAGQTREIVAARSQAEAARCAGVKSSRLLFCLGETGNKGEIATATAKPGVVFWRRLDHRTDLWTAAR